MVWESKINQLYFDTEDDDNKDILNLPIETMPFLVFDTKQSYAIIPEQDLTVIKNYLKS